MRNSWCPLAMQRGELFFSENDFNAPRTQPYLSKFPNMGCTVVAWPSAPSRRQRTSARSSSHDGEIQRRIERAAERG